ncbi:hypothetical protein ACIBCB_37385 [Streptomyces uncialis]|uniref:hypothetical protein n=1 Tax=Streptomyces uncialis TaxID=1048205 RepID=UPI002E308491|nr:hypothetical protein [Streptomyces uncialis]
MASINYPYPNPENDSERAANRQASDDYQRQEEEAGDFLDWAEGFPAVTSEVLLEQVRLDLTTAGLHVAPPEPLTDGDQGGVIVYLDDDAQVVVDWLPHARLDRAALDMVEADRTDHEAVIRYETVRSAMDTALATILTGFGYTTRRPQSGSGTGTGHIVLQPSTTPDAQE